MVQNKEVINIDLPENEVSCDNTTKFGRIFPDDDIGWEIFNFMSNKVWVVILNFTMWYFLINYLFLVLI